MKVTAIREYLKLYPDDRLAALLAHAEDGKLSYHSCRCLVGAINANHALKGVVDGPLIRSHYARAKKTELARAAETEFMLLMNGPHLTGGDTERRPLLIPLIRDEMARRE